MSWQTWFRDWRRGWTDEDLASVLCKMQEVRPGYAVSVTPAEMRAHCAHMREQGKASVFAA